MVISKQDEGKESRYSIEKFGVFSFGQAEHDSYLLSKLILLKTFTSRESVAQCSATTQKLKSSGLLSADDWLQKSSCWFAQPNDCLVYSLFPSHSKIEEEKKMAKGY